MPGRSIPYGFTTKFLQLDNFFNEFVYLTTREPLNDNRYPLKLRGEYRNEILHDENKLIIFFQTLHDNFLTASLDEFRERKF